MTDAFESFRLTGRVAVVTGGGGALGDMTCLALARAGARVAVIDLDPAAASATAARIGVEGHTAIALSADLSLEARVLEAFEAVERQLGSTDILVNAISAPVERYQPEDFPVSAWDQMLQSNLTSYFLCSKAAAAQMIRSERGGSIVNFGSIAGVTALGRGSMAYSVAKGGVVQLTREMAYAWASKGIRVNAILPSQFANRWWVEQRDDPARTALLDRVVGGIPLGRLGEPHEITGPVLFLASDAASMVTGALLPVDGGNLAMNAGASRDW
jgi:NAD(P)-dependent dehydrogenase (short-subunit alcohol dehydrogenase family)